MSAVNQAIPEYSDCERDASFYRPAWSVARRNYSWRMTHRNGISWNSVL